MKILHIAPDEKFINAIHWQFEEIFPNRSNYVVFLSKSSNEAKFIKVLKNVSFIKENSSSITHLFKEADKSDIVILQRFVFHSI